MVCKNIALSLLLCIGLNSPHAYAQGACSLDPHIELVRISKQLFNNQGNTASLEFVKDNLFSYIDVEYMAKYIVGRYHWNNASERDKESFLKAYEKALSKTYTQFAAKEDSKDITVSLKKSIPNAGKNQAVVYGIVHAPKKPKAILGMYFHCHDGAWKIYDLSYDNIYILEQIKLQFATVVRHNGLPGLTKELQKVYEP